MISPFLTRIVDEGVTKRDLVDALAAAGRDLRRANHLAGLLEVLQELLARAQHAGTVRADVDVEDVMVLLVSLSIASRRTGDDPGRSERVFAVFRDGLRGPGA